MNPNELLTKIIAYGADEKGIQDRFCGNVELYQSCFLEFINEPNFAELREAIHTKNYKQAFENAHALKGISGNLGITEFYNAIRILTESLRYSKYDNVDEEYAEVERQHEKLKRLIFEEPTPEQQATMQAPSQAEEEHKRLSRFRLWLKHKNNRQIMGLLCFTVLVVALILFSLVRINTAHGRNVEIESGQHLVEITNQIKLYVEDNIATDWNIAQSVGDSILYSSYDNDDSAVYDMLQKKKEVWGVSDLMLYTKNGYCIYSDGSSSLTDIASITVYNARTNGKWLSILDSRLFFTVPLETALTFHGSQIVAVSVVRNMSSFLDDMTFSSFNGAAWMYLTDKDGIVISSLSKPTTIQAFNVQAVIEGMDIRPLKDDSVEDFISNPETSACLFSNDSTKIYGVSTQIVTDSNPMMLFYFVPENVVNDLMSGFSDQLIHVSAIVVLLFALIVFSAFIIQYYSKKKGFDLAIHNRERMFDLLVNNSRTAFVLYSVNKPQPEYQSANIQNVIGDEYWVLKKTELRFYISNQDNIETDNIAIVNEALWGWDGKSTFRSDYLCNARNTTPTYFIFELYPVDNATSDYVGIMQDVTKLYAREETAKEAMAREKQANQAKTSFLSSMSHDIRTPMNAIMNMSSFALESIDQPKKLNNYLHIIHKSSEHLLHLINDVLDMNRIESGKVVVVAAPFSIVEEMQKQVEIIRPLCNAKKQTLLIDFSGLTDTPVFGDALKLSQIVMNLLSNASKFTPEKGAVRFIAKEVPSLKDDMMTIHFTVEDNGIGISMTDINHIFEPFSRSTDKAVSKIEGTGLGLAIVKNYVDAMGGTIHCESEYGEGTIFTVELFFKKADVQIDQNNTRSALTNASFLGMHALVAEDNELNQLIAKEVLERMGFILDFADDGSEAVKKFRLAKPYTYDVIYMDIQMPVMNGYVATVEIRASDHPQAKTIPIIAMTANAFAEDIEKARVAGMNGYVSKPIISFNLAEQTRKVMNIRED